MKDLNGSIQARRVTVFSDEESDRRMFLMNRLREVLWAPSIINPLADTADLETAVERLEMMKAGRPVFVPIMGVD